MRKSTVNTSGGPGDEGVFVDELVGPLQAELVPGEQGKMPTFESKRVVGRAVHTGAWILTDSEADRGRAHPE